MQDRPPSHTPSHLRSVIRWVTSGFQRNYEWQHFPLYWNIRQGIRMVLHRFGAISFSMNIWIDSQKSSVSAVFVIIRRISLQFATALILVQTLEVVGRLVATPSGFDTRSIRGPSLIPDLLSALESFRLDTPAVVSMLSTQVQVAGVFLALYFTAMSFVINAYLPAPDDVRRLLLRHMEGNKYIDIIGLFGAMSAFLLLRTTLGLSVGFLSVVVVSLLGVLSLLGFVQLGIETFLLLDPTTVGRKIPSDIVRRIQAVTPVGRRWRDSSFQRVYQAQAERLFLSYHSVINYSAEKKQFEGRALLRLVTAALALQRFYVGVKSTIPSQSLWFRRREQHADWLLSSNFEIDLALGTGVPLKSELVPDLMWFETEIETVVRTAINTLTLRGDLEALMSIAAVVHDSLGYFGGYWGVKEGDRLIRVFSSQIGEVARIVEGQGVDLENGSKQIRFALSITKHYGLGLIALCYRLSAKLRETTPEKFSAEIQSVDWSRIGTIYRINLPREVLEQLEFLEPRLEFESRVEGDTITPRWYQEQIAAIGFARYLDSASTLLVSLLEEAYVGEAESLATSGQPLMAAQMIQYSLEASDACGIVIVEAQACQERQSVFQRLADVPLPDTNWDELVSRVSSARERLILLYAGLVPQLGLLPGQAGYYPDYFGQAYLHIANECVSAITSSNEGLFSRLYPRMFQTYLLATERIMKGVGERTDRASMVFKTEPLADLAAISGLAFVYAELDDNLELKNVVRRAWNRYLGLAGDESGSSSIIDSVISSMRYRQSVFAILPRDTLRTRWKVALEQDLRNRGLLDQELDSSTLSARRRLQDKPALIRALCGRWQVQFDLADVFLVAYLREKPEATGLMLPPGALRFSEALQHQEQMGGG